MKWNYDLKILLPDYHDIKLLTLLNYHYHLVFLALYAGSIGACMRKYGK